tara:strand:+ start:44419 stop:45900 length:1482 start_codon:yes stop_codon:yes gene_type:complete
LYKSTNNTIQTFWVALGSLSAFGLAIVSSAILSRYLAKEDYGTYRQIIFVYSTLLVVFSAGLPRVFAYFLPRYSLSQGKTIVKKVSLVLVGCGLLFSICLYLFSGLIARILDNEELEYGLKVFSIVPFFLLPTLGIEGIFSTYKKTIYIAIYNTLTRFVMLLCIIVPVIVYDGNYINALYGWVVASVFTFVIAILFKSLPFKGISKSKTDLKIGEILSYSLPLVGAGIWGVVIKSSDMFYISRFFGEEAFAEYANGFTSLPFVTIITSSAAVVLMPIFSKYFQGNNNTKEILNVWLNALKKSTIIIYPLIIYFFVYADDVVVLLFSESYLNSSIYFRINLILNVFNIIIFAPLFLATGRTKLYANVHMFLALAIWLTGYLVVIVFNSPTAIAYNSVAIHILKVIIFIYLASRILNIPFLKFFPLRQIGRSLFQSFVVIGFVYFSYAYLVNSDSIIIKLLVTFSAFCIILLATGKFFRIDYYGMVKPFFKSQDN